jgi:transposase
MSKAYPSNLTRTQYEFVSDMIPEPKPGGRPREVDMWEVLNAIFYILVEGVRWRAEPLGFSGVANGIHLFSLLGTRWNMAEHT